MIRPYAPFDEALKFGQRAEERVRDLLCYGGALVSKFGDTNRNDFQVVYKNQTHRVEVKCEDNYASSGNICIEFWQGKYQSSPSGIATSEATIIIHTLGDNCALYRRVQMYSYIRTNMQSGRLNLRNFGDNGNKGVVVALKNIMDSPWLDCRPLNTLASSLLWNK